MIDDCLLKAVATQVGLVKAFSGVGQVDANDLIVEAAEVGELSLNVRPEVGWLLSQFKRVSKGIGLGLLVAGISFMQAGDDQNDRPGLGRFANRLEWIDDFADGVIDEASGDQDQMGVRADRADVGGGVVMSFAEATGIEEANDGFCFRRKSKGVCSLGFGLEAVTDFGSSGFGQKANDGGLTRLGFADHPENGNGCLGELSFGSGCGGLLFVGQGGFGR